MCTHSSETVWQRGDLAGDGVFQAPRSYRRRFMDGYQLRGGCRTGFTCPPVRCDGSVLFRSYSPWQLPTRLTSPGERAAPGRTFKSVHLVYEQQPHQETRAPVAHIAGARRAHTVAHCLLKIWHSVQHTGINPERFKDSPKHIFADAAEVI